MYRIITSGIKICLDNSQSLYSDTRLLLHTFSYQIWYFRAHLSTVTIGRADSAEGHPDIRAEWMTFRVQFPIFHHFLWKELCYLNRPCMRPQSHTRTQPYRSLSAAAKLLYSSTVSYINDLSCPPATSFPSDPIRIKI